MKQKTTMPFSEALLLGLPEIRFTNEYWLSRNNRGGGQKCMGCLVGAALYAVGHRDLACSYQPKPELHKHWPWTAKPILNFHCSVPRCYWATDNRGTVRDIATHLAWHYQAAELTAEQIADIFRKIEPKPRARKCKKEVLDRTPVASYTGVAEAE